MSDWDLLQEFVSTKSDLAFRKLVERHRGFVYQVCFRETDSQTLAEDAGIAVFVLLSQKAHTIRQGVLLTSWLFTAARLTARSAVRNERRRRIKEHEAYEMSQDLNQAIHCDDNSQFESHINDALAALSDRERDAILLRFQDDLDVVDVGMALGISESAAKMRLSRGLSKLRQRFTTRAFVMSESAIISALVASNTRPIPASFISKSAAILSFSTPNHTPLELLAKGVYITMQTAKYKYLIIGAIFLLLSLAGFSGYHEWKVSHADTASATSGTNGLVDLTSTNDNSTSTGNDPASADHRAITAQIEQFTNSYNSHDIKTISSVVSPDFSAPSRNGPPATKDLLLSGISHRFTNEPNAGLTLTLKSISIQGDSAITRLGLSFHGMSSGNTTSDQTWEWVKRGGGWLLVSGT